MRVLPQKVDSDGNKQGRIIVPNSSKFMANQIVRLKDSNGLNQEYQIKRILNSFVFLGDKGKGNQHRADLTQWLRTNQVTIEANEQERPKTPIDQIEKFIYAEEPINAAREILVDIEGEYIDPYRYESSYFPKFPAQREQAAPPYAHSYIPNIIDKFLDGATYNKVENTIEGDKEIITFRNGSTIVKEIEFRYHDASWIVVNPDQNNIGGSIALEDEGLLLTEDGDTISILA